MQNSAQGAPLIQFLVAVQMKAIPLNDNIFRKLASVDIHHYTIVHITTQARLLKLLLQHHTALAATEIRDLNGRLPIHVAVARGSSSVLRELLVAGARVETRALNRHHSSSSVSPTRRQNRRNRSQNNANIPITL